MDIAEPIPGKSPVEAIKTPHRQPELSEKHNPLIEKYQARAAEMKIKPVEGGDWLVTDRVEKKKERLQLEANKRLLQHGLSK